MMNLPKKPVLPRTLLSGGLLMASAALSWGQILFSDNFDGHAADTTPAAPWTGSIGAETGGDLIATADTANHFQRGTENQMLLFRNDTDTTGMALQANNVISAEVLTFSLDVFEPNTALNDLTDLWFYNGGIAGANNVGRVRFGRGQVNLDANMTYGHDTLAHFDVILNNSVGAVSYGDGQSLSSGALDVWMDGNLVGDGLAMGGARGTVNGFQFNTPTGGMQEINFDSFTVREGAFVIPEPGTAAVLAGLGALLFVAWRRSSRKAAV